MGTGPELAIERALNRTARESHPHSRSLLNDETPRAVSLAIRRLLADELLCGTLA